MYHYFDSVRNTHGEVMSGFFVRCVDTTTGSGATLYADKNMTPIITVSGIADAAQVDTDGNVNFYVSSGNYHLDFYAPDGVSFVKRVQNVAMIDATGISMTTPQQFGAVGDGVADDTAAIQAALNSKAGVISILPGTYKITGTLNFAFSGQRIVGGGASSTALVFYTGTASGLVCNGKNTCGISGIKLKGSGNTGGELLLVENCSAFSARDLRVETGYNGITVLSTNNVLFDGFVIADNTGAYGIRFAGTSTTRADVLKLHGGEISHSSNSAITSILWESYAHSMTLSDVRVINGGRGLYTHDSSGTGTDLAIPSFLQAAILEFDSPSGEAIRADDLRDAWITNLYNNASIGTNGVHFSSNAWSIRMDNARVASASQHGIYIAGRFVVVSNSYCYANGQSASNAYDGIFVDSTAADVTVNNCISGYDSSFGTRQRYGLNVDPASTRVRYFGNDFNGNLTDFVNGGTDLSYRAASSNRHTFSNTNGVHLMVGGSTASVVNNLRIAGAATTAAPQVLAEGADTNIDLKLTPKGTGLVAFGTTRVSSTDAPVTGYIQIKDSTGTTYKLAIIG